MWLQFQGMSILHDLLYWGLNVFKTMLVSIFTYFICSKNLTISMCPEPQATWRQLKPLDPSNSKSKSKSGFLFILWSLSLDSS